MKTVYCVMEVVTDGYTYSCYALRKVCASREGAEAFSLQTLKTEKGVELETIEEELGD